MEEDVKASDHWEDIVHYLFYDGSIPDIIINYSLILIFTLMSYLPSYLLPRSLQTCLIAQFWAVQVRASERQPKL